MRDWRFWLIAIAFLPVSFSIGGPIPNMENILKGDGLPAGEIVGLASLIGLSVIAGRVIGGWLMDRIWAPAVAFVLLSAPALACWLLSRGHLDYTTAAASVVLIGFAAGVEFDLMAFLVARYFGMKSYTSIYGILYGFFAAGSGVAPVVYGAAFDKSHSYAGPLLLSAAFFVGGACSSSPSAAIAISGMRPRRSDLINPSVGRRRRRWTSIGGSDLERRIGREVLRHGLSLGRGRGWHVHRSPTVQRRDGRLLAQQDAVDSSR